MNKKIAILIFANSAEYEAKQKPFQSSEVLFDVLNAQILKVVKNTGLPYFLSSEKNQIGATFGERFTNAIESIYNRGFEAVVTIGNDTPHLQTKHILTAVHQLKQNDIVLGKITLANFKITKKYIKVSLIKSYQLIVFRNTFRY